MKFILIYRIDYEEPYIMRFDTVEEMDKQINELLQRHGDLFSIFFAAQILREYNYEPAQVVKSLKRSDSY